MDGQYVRTEMVIGKSGVEKLRSTAVMVLGIGGVGSYTAEALARAGVGKLMLVDKDTVDVTNKQAAASSPQHCRQSQGRGDGRADSRYRPGLRCGGRAMLFPAGNC